MRYTNSYTLDDFRAALARREKERLLPARPRTRIATGIAKLGESRKEAQARVERETWRRFCTAIVAAAQARLELLKGRAADEYFMCPWATLNNARLVAVDEPEPGKLRARSSCPRTCRCGGAGEVTASLYRAHCERMAAEYSQLAEGKR